MVLWCVLSVWYNCTCVEHACFSQFVCLFGVFYSSLFELEGLVWGGTLKVPPHLALPFFGVCVFVVVCLLMWFLLLLFCFLLLLFVFVNVCCFVSGVVIFYVVWLVCFFVSCIIVCFCWSVFSFCCLYLLMFLICFGFVLCVCECFWCCSL